MLSRRKRLVILAVTTVSTLVLAACGSDDAGSGSGSASGSGGSSEPVEIAVYHGPIAEQALPTIALDLGLYPEGCTVSMESGDANVGLTLVTSGRVQAYVNASPVPEQVASGGAPVQWAALFQEGISTEFIAQPGIDSVEDLRGKSIGIINPTGTIWALIQVALRDAGLEASDVTTVPLGSIPGVNSAFAAGTVDATVTTAGSVGAIKAQKPDTVTLVDFSEDFDWIGSGVAVNSDWAEENPDGLVCLLTGLNRALVAIQEDPEVARESLAKVTGQTGPGLDFAVESLPEVLTEQLQPVTLEQEQVVMDAMEEQGEDWATEEFAEQMISDPAWVEEAIANE